MIVYIGADHRGFYLKEKIKSFLHEEGIEFHDVGSFESDPNDDYPDFTKALAEKVSGENGEVRGIAICGSGIGVDIVANKFPGVRSALAISPDHIRAGRNDDDVNVLSLGAGFVSEDAAIEIVRVFLSTPFGADERYARRLRKIEEIEHKE